MERQVEDRRGVLVRLAKRSRDVVRMAHLFGRQSERLECEVCDVTLDMSLNVRYSSGDIAGLPLPLALLCISRMMN